MKVRLEWIMVLNRLDLEPQMKPNAFIKLHLRLALFKPRIFLAILFSLFFNTLSAYTLTSYWLIFRRIQGHNESLFEVPETLLNSGRNDAIADPRNTAISRTISMPCCSFADMIPR